MNPRLAHTQVIFLHKHWQYPSLFPTIPVVLKATVGVEDLGMRLLLREMHASGKR